MRLTACPSPRLARSPSACARRAARRSSRCALAYLDDGAFGAQVVVLGGEAEARATVAAPAAHLHEERDGAESAEEAHVIAREDLQPQLRRLALRDPPHQHLVQ
eukprot:scaffold5826_cov291-Prasinococcus_capsulatus_cf.AAC.4